MKKIILILFLLSIGFIPIGMIFRIQHWLGGNIFFTLGLLGLIVYFLTKSVKDLMKNRNDKFNILFQIIVVLMSITLFARYLYHSFWDYPGLLIVPLFIVTSLFYLLRNKVRDFKLVITSILYLIFTIPLFGLEFDKAPRQYVPKEWYNRYNVDASVPIKGPFGFKYKQTEQLSIKAFDLKKSRYYYDAIIIYRQALKIEPQNSKLLFDMSECYALTNQLETAISILDTAILLDSTYAPFYNNRGLMHYKLDENNLALKDFQNAIRIDSTHFVYYANIALVYYYENDYEKACSAIKRAESLGLDITDQKFLKKIKKEYCK